jgi:hypothetical protein
MSFLLWYWFGFAWGRGRICFGFLETVSHYVAQPALKLAM